MTEAHNEEAQLPPPLPEGGLRIIPLGGLGAIGRNMTVFEYDGKLLVVDCGVLFPDVEQPGVDLILPDFGPILDRLDDIQAIVLTHGHEDHIGAVPYLLAHKADIPLVGSQFTLALVEAKLAERRIQPYTLTVREGGRERLGPFECEFFAVNHSIPDALAVAIRTPAGLVLHTGDFKMDQLPLDGRITDLAGFARLGAEGVDLLLSDSTNAEIPGFVTPEREIGPVLDSIFAKARGRIIVASFASHVHRVQQVFDSALEHGRKVALIGRSMVRNMGIARDLGLLNIPAGLVVGLDEATSMPPEQIVLMSTGSQGEPMSALGRMASGDHRHITIAPGDTVVLASSLVPGNETSVYRVINRLARAGAVVVHKDVAKVHVSGHAPAGELLYLLNVVRPSNLMPVHGEWRHLRAHARLGIESGVAPDRVVLCEDGDVVDLVEGRASLVGRVKSRYVYVDGLAVGDVSESLLTERRILGDGGFIATTVVVDSVTGKVVAGPTVSAKGFSEDAAAFNAVIPLVTEALNRAAADGITDPHQLQQIVRRTVGRWVNDAYRRRPMIVPTVVEV
ncbi:MULTISPECIES: ribonuclease J [Micromonospora]|uniref:Ribonuclease J n=2 Tax=Micromonospora TaxID=1873 RepID=A0A9X0I8G9_9ACTN|nr:MULTISPECIES: ribonuclease J [Micromonospora]AEB43526.1 RNA-metabolising metallo-beta-lactamase [Micromonospora maris AB-18-032]KUJ48833.1 ribonuclease [Micromonospora maris]PMR58970.1 RNase J family beta-CASP ribonuclease [Verrucosispora sp. ts21]RUL92861.1 ribonuclease J [Verrucosispora sp. FIM060022]GIJ17787.1 ribonuclease J [Micromonospora gifhornensis]